VGQEVIPTEWLTGIVLAAIGLAAIWFGGRKSGKTAAKIEEMESYADTRKKMDEAGRMSDADAARQWLSERSKR
jgi:hypothetical protein